MKVICFLRELDIPIDAISKILKEEHPEKVIGLLIEQQESVLSIKAPHCRQMTAARSFSLAYLTKLSQRVTALLLLEQQYRAIYTAADQAAIRRSHLSSRGKSGAG